MKKFYNAVFNSVATAIVSVVILAGLSVFGLMHLIGEQPVAIVVSVISVILLVTKVVNKLSR